MGDVTAALSEQRAISVIRCREGTNCIILYCTCYTISVPW